MIFDLHVHTSISPCSRLKVEDILEHALGLGLDGVCITDHESMLTQRSLKGEIQADGLCIIIGMEYTTEDGDFLIFGSDQPLPPGLDAVALLTRVNQMGGAVVAAHPFRKARPVKEYIIGKGLCTILESVNGRNTLTENQRVENWVNKYKFHETGGSDAHSLEELGKFATRLTVPVQSRSDLIFALKNGFCYPESCFQKQLRRA